MSGKDSSFSKKRTRRQTTDTLKIIENENEDYKRFSYYFRKFSDENNMHFVVEINNYVVKENGHTFPIGNLIFAQKDVRQESNMPIINAYYDMDVKLKKVIVQSPNIDTRILLTLDKTTIHFPKLFTLILDYCDLNSDHITLLAKTLKLNENIKELSLKGNPNDRQNFYLLIGCKLKILNLKFCEISVTGLQRIAEEFLNGASSSTLIHLDLSSNMLFNESCKYVAKILRCDRTLLSLNLADCKIRDEGFKDIIECFQKFSLYDEEIYIRRKLRLEYFKLLEKEKDGYFPEKKNNLSSVEEQAEPIKDDLTIAGEKLTNHPFTSECTQENDEFICNGNYKLASLNIAYNHLTKPSFDLILKTVMEQSGAFGLEKGLNRIVLEGNPRDHKCENVRNAIEEYLLSKKKKRSDSANGINVNRSKVNIKKRKSTLTNTILESK